MALSIVMPALEMAQETGKLLSWRKQEGESVTKGELLFEIETDKAVVEIEALGSGILGGVTAREGHVIPVGQTIAWLLAPGEAVPASTGPTETGRRTDGDSGLPPRADAGPAEAGRPSQTGTGPVRISPKARHLAREHGLDIAAIAGSGPGGEILADDVLKAAASKPPDSRSVQPPSDQSSAIGRLMAERTTQSWTTVPHFFMTREVDASTLVGAREALVTRVETSHGVKPTHTDVIISAVARALRRHPRMNAHWVDRAIRTNADVNIGVAMAVDDGVVVGVVPRADVASVGDIAVKRRDLTERARANRLSPADLGGATFTISNLGMYHVDAFTAIVVAPQAGILAVGAIAPRVVAVNGQPAVRPMMAITLSCDHRVVDGARAAIFLNDVVETIEGDTSWT